MDFRPKIFEKHPNKKFNENPSCGTRVVPCERADVQTDMTKLTVTFRSFAEVLSKKEKTAYVGRYLKIKKEANKR
jgi:hypothetical protein